MVTQPLIKCHLWAPLSPCRIPATGSTQPLQNTIYGVHWSPCRITAAPLQMAKRPKREPANSHPLIDHKTNSCLFPIASALSWFSYCVRKYNFISSLEKLAEIPILKSAEKICLILNFIIKIFRSLRNNVSGLPKEYGVKITEHNVRELFN